MRDELHFEVTTERTTPEGPFYAHSVTDLAAWLYSNRDLQCCKELPGVTWYGSRKFCPGRARLLEAIRARSPESLAQVNVRCDKCLRVVAWVQYDVDTRGTGLNPPTDHKPWVQKSSQP